MNNKSKLQKINYSFLIILGLLIIYFFFPFYEEIKQKLFPLIAVLGLILVVLGIYLLILAQAQSGKLKIFLIIAGISAICPLIFSILHNLFYGLAITFTNLKTFFKVLHGSAFIISLLVSPLTLLIGAVASLIILEKEK